MAAAMGMLEMNFSCASKMCSPSVSKPTMKPA
jgi:hypothetical protein